MAVVQRVAAQIPPYRVAGQVQHELAHFLATYSRRAGVQAANLR